MEGKCDCGKLYCSICGRTGANLQFQLAMKKLMAEIIDAKLSAKEIEILGKVGLAAIEAIRIETVNGFDNENSGFVLKNLKKYL